MSQAETKRNGFPVMLSLCILVILAIIGTWCATISKTPAPTAIHAVVNASSPNGSIVVRSVDIPAPEYVGGQGSLEEVYTSNLEVAISNTSKEDLYVAIMYSSQGGSIKGYSPGSLVGAEVVQLKGNWSGKKTIPYKHTRFVSGGNISIEMATCAGPERSDASLFLDPGKVDDVFYTGTHVIVPSITTKTPASRPSAATAQSEKDQVRSHPPTTP